MSETVISVSEPARRTVTDAAALRRELHGVREKVPHHLLQPRRVARDRPEVRVNVRRISTPFATPPAAPFPWLRDDGDRSTFWMSRRSLPDTMRLMSSRSEISCACTRVLRAMTSRPRCTAPVA